MSGKGGRAQQPCRARGAEIPAVRADARRNTDALLEAALAVFAASGVDAPVREIAARAGVGVGTVYRHFPQRSDLVAAVFLHEVDACADAAPALAAAHGPGEALARWMQRYAAFVATKRGLAAGAAFRRSGPSMPCRPISTSGCAPRCAACSRRPSRPARSAPTSSQTNSLSAVASLCMQAAARPPTTPAAWSPCWSTACAMARAGGEGAILESFRSKSSTYKGVIARPTLSLGLSGQPIFLAAKLGRPHGPSDSVGRAMTIAAPSEKYFCEAKYHPPRRTPKTYPRSVGKISAFSAPPRESSGG